MPRAGDTHLLLRAFADELARCGMRAACTSPGSRCAPLVLALAREPRIRCHSHIDERCAGFFALGLAKASGCPVAVTCTSGTAVAELMPAVIEAHEAAVPLLVLSADRPAELREIGAGQTIDQLKIFGAAANWFFEVGCDGAGEASLRWMRTLACRAYWHTLHGRPGPVHLNFPLREPLVSDEVPPEDASGRAGGRPYLVRPPSAPAAPQSWPHLQELVAGARRGVLVAGRYERDAGPRQEGSVVAACGPRPERSAGSAGCASLGAGSPTLGAAAAAFCAASGWPLLADPLSGARRGEAAVAHYDALLREPAALRSLLRGGEPDLVIRVGDLPTSKPLRSWLASLGPVRQVGLDPQGGWQDPDAVLGEVLALDPARSLMALAEGAGGAARDPDWLAGWRAANERAAEAITGVLAQGGLSEPAVARELGALLPQSATLFVASSMPVRDIEGFWPAREDPPRVLCNRGANGIDGTVSSAFGAAAAGAGGPAAPTVLLIGDVAMAHDIGGLLAARRLGLKLTIVLVNNAGGGIFDFLPLAGVAPRELFAEHIATPPQLDFACAAELFGLAHECPSDLGGFREALERALAGEQSTIVEVRGDRAANLALHRNAWEAVQRALARP